MDVMKYISENVMILIPVMYILGIFLKRLDAIKDKYIPFIITGLAILFCIGITGVNIDAAIQGILIAGVTVLGNQMYIQSKKDE